jgi:stage II sporulation protein D
MSLTIAQRRRPRRQIAAWALILMLAPLVNGCRERELTSPQPTAAIAPSHWIRVLLGKDIDTCTIMVPSTYEIRDTSTGASLGRFAANSEAIAARVIQGQLFIGEKAFPYRQITLIPDQPFVFYLNDKGYRGEMRLAISDNGSSVDIINNVPLETYLAGVVGAEMPSYWEPEALKAQAIASRTYCLYVKQRFGPQRIWDVSRTQANQVYLGLEAESPKIWEAVNQTTGQILNCRDENGKEGIFPAYFSSICGGHTEDSKKVFGDSFDALQAVECPWCGQVAGRDMFFWPMVQLDKSFVNSQLTARYPSLGKLGPISNIVVDKQSEYSGFSRITNLKLVGASGQVSYLRAEDFRLAVDPTGKKIRSTICKITAKDRTWAFFSGRGFGHGVGLCQYGAQGMARQGAVARQILDHYYPSAGIIKLY